MALAHFDHDSGEIVSAVVKEQPQQDDHASPAVLVRPDHRLMVFYSGHRGRWMIYRLSANAEDITSWGTEHAASGHTSDYAGYTYPNAAFLTGEDDRRNVFWRGADYLPMFAFSETGMSWSEPAVLVRADGSPVGKMEDLPLTFGDADLVYDAAGAGATAWLWDVAFDASGNPVVAYTAFPHVDDHRYRYARWDGVAWVDTEIAPGGARFPTVEKGRRHFDPYYSGGVALDHTDPSIAYLSRPVSGVFEIERWTTPDGGYSWTSEAVTSGSVHDNVRPLVPIGHAPGGPGLIWMNGSYVDFTTYSTSLRMK
ncbi:MAG: BNR-4 repeat-containing protein [Candidatus Eisenbacteria bacterium]